MNAIKLFLFICLFPLYSLSGDNRDSQNDVQLTEIFLNANCLELGSYFIKTEKDFISFIKENNCRNISSTKIDFNRYSLIGVVFSAGGCHEPKWKSTLKCDKGIGDFYFEIIQRGSCEMHFKQNAWFLFEKQSAHCDSLNFIFNNSVLKTDSI